MISPEDAVAHAALTTQLRELSAALTQLERARRDLLPGPATFWRGAARHAYDAAIDALSTTVDAGIAALRAARDHTSAALAGMGDRV
jgi:uncharacterized protein YukE